MDEVRNIDEFENYDAYEIIIKTKSDIITTIRQNITDGEVMDDIINSLETTAAKSIIAKKWTSLPFIGNVRPNEERISVLKNMEHLKQASKILPKSQYLMFKKELGKEERKRIAAQRTKRWLMQRAAAKYRKQFEELSKKNGENYASLWCYFRFLLHSFYDINDNPYEDVGSSETDD